MGNQIQLTMKKLKIAFAFIALGSLWSCSKDFTCECTTTQTIVYDDGLGTTTTTTKDPKVNTTVYSDVKKSNLPVGCKDNSSVNTSSSTNGTVTTTNKTESSTTCEIK